MPQSDANTDLLILSDLHLGEGKGDPFAEGAALEDFNSDAAFFRLLIDRHTHLAQAHPGHKWTLIVNGDLFEFMQIVSLPEAASDPDAHQHLVADREQEHPNIKLFGLGTEPDASAWKVHKIARGHPWFFRALAWWVAQGHRLVIIKGNHDVELYFPEVQAAVREALVRAAAQWSTLGEPAASPRQPPGVSVRAPSVEAVKVSADHIAFVPLAYYRAGMVYVEHGTQHEPLNTFEDFLRPILPQAGDDLARIRLPLGSLIVRFGLNRLEAISPLFENTRPITAAFGFLIRQHLWLTLRTVIENFGVLSSAIVDTLELNGRDAPRAATPLPRAEQPPAEGDEDATYPDRLPNEVLHSILDLRAAPALGRSNSLMISAGGLAIAGLLATLALGLVYVVVASLGRALDGGVILSALALAVVGVAGMMALMRAGRAVHARKESLARMGWLGAVALLFASASRVALGLADVFGQRGDLGARLLALNILGLFGALAVRTLLRDIFYSQLKQLRAHWHRRGQLNWVQRWFYSIGLVERRLMPGLVRIAFGRSGLAIFQLVLVALIGLAALGFAAIASANSLDLAFVTASLAVSVFNGLGWGWRGIVLAVGLLTMPVVVSTPGMTMEGPLTVSTWGTLLGIAIALGSIAALVYMTVRYAGQKGEATVKERYMVAAMRRVGEALAGRGLPVSHLIAGHDHYIGAQTDPTGGAAYLNTGCWLPIYELHRDSQEKVLHLGFAQVTGLGGEAYQAGLYVWNDRRRAVEPWTEAAATP